MDLYSRQIVGWQVDRRMTSSLVCGALMKAYNLRTRPPGLVVHTDRGTQYTGQRFQALLSSYRLRSSMCSGILSSMCSGQLNLATLPDC